MRLVKSLIKYLLVFVFGVVVATFVSLTTVAYYAVEHLTLTKPVEQSEKKHSKKSKEPEVDATPEGNWINSNIIDVFRMGDQYTTELNQFDELVLKTSHHKMPAFCETICNESTFDRIRMLDERTPYLESFYKENGERALKDPFFQLKLKEIGILSEVFPSAFRAVWFDVEQQRNTNPTTTQKLNWALRFEVVAIKELIKLSSRWDDLLLETDRIQTWREQIQSCQKGLRPVKDLRAECEQL